MQPDLELEQIAPELIGTGAQAVVENAKRLGLTWTITPATITSVDPVEAIVDGDTVTIGMVSMIGSVFLGQRVYVIQVPPSGNFIAGAVQRNPYRDTKIVIAVSATVEFTNIPSDLAVIQITYTARVDVNGAVDLQCRVNNDTTASQHRTSYAGWTGAAYITPAQVASTVWLTGVIGGDNTALVFNGGKITINNWKADHTVNGYLSFESFAAPFVDGVNSFGRMGGGSYVGVSPYFSLTFLPSAGSFDVGTQFELIGYY